MYFVVYTMGQWAWNKRYLILSYLTHWAGCWEEENDVNSKTDRQNFVTI